MSHFPLAMPHVPNDAVEYIAYLRTLEARDALTYGCGALGEVFGLSHRRCRAIVVGWLTNVAALFKLGRETLALGLQLLDRRFAQVPAYALEQYAQLQCLGCAALLVACKVEEIHPPKLGDFVFCCNTRELCAMEVELLTALDGGRLGRAVVPSVHSALAAAFGGDRAQDDVAYQATAMLLDLSALGPWEDDDEPRCRYTPTLAVCGAHLLALATLNAPGCQPAWPAAAAALTGVDAARAVASAHACARACVWALAIKGSASQNVLSLYAKAKRHRVSKIPALAPFVTRRACGGAARAAILARLDGLAVGPAQPPSHGPASRTRSRTALAATARSR